MNPIALAPADPLLFLSVDASRTGSPRILASLLHWLATSTDHPRQLLLEHGGPLLTELQRDAEVRVLERGVGRSRPEAIALGLDELGRHGGARRVRRARLRQRRRGLPSPGLVWANGAGTLRWLDALPPEVPVVAHIHELEVGIDRSLAGLDVTAALARPQLLVAVSQAVADHLVDERGVDPARVIVHHAWHSDAGGAALPPGARADPAVELGLPPEALLVLGCGTVGWRKGTSLFLALAQALGPKVGGRPVHWAWLGSGRADDVAHAERERVLRGLADRVHLLGERADVRPWFDACTAFALTSREDPFSLVALEAAAAGKPVLAFASGGVAELVGPDADACVSDLLDLDGFTRRLHAVLADDDLRARLGDAARAAAARHEAADAIPRLWSAVTGEQVGPLGH